MRDIRNTHKAYARLRSFACMRAGLIALVLAYMFMASLSYAEQDVDKQFGIIKPEPGAYPVTLFTNEQVPIPWDADASQISWVDSNTLIYQTHMPDLTPEQTRQATVPIITVNLETFEKKEIAKSVPRTLCFSPLSKNIYFFTSFTRDRTIWADIITHQYGVFGGTMKTVTTQVAANSQPNYHLFREECIFRHPYDYNTQGHKVIDGVNVYPLPQGDGYLSGRGDPETDPPGTFLYLSPEGEKKTFIFARTRWGMIFPPRFDMASGQYLMDRTNDDQSLTIRRYDRRLNLLSEKTYPKGPWASGISFNPVKEGYLIKRINYSGRSWLYLLTQEGKIVEILRDFGLKHLFSVSPDGCKAVFLHEDIHHLKMPFDTDHPPKMAILKLC